VGKASLVIGSLSKLKQATNSHTESTGRVCGVMEAEMDVNYKLNLAWEIAAGLACL
jgi:hypothetical protein